MEEKVYSNNIQFLKAKEKGENQALVQFWKNYYLYKMNKGDLDSTIIGLQTLREEMRDHEDSKATDWTLITINPYLHIKMSELKAVIEKLISKKWITTYTYCYEQRSEDSNEYKGFHCHLLIHRKDKTQCHLIREIRNTVKNICDTSNTHILNFRNLKTDDDVRKAYNYITGEKADGNKHIKQMIDKEFRVFHYLKPFYQSDPNKLIFDIINAGKIQEEDIQSKDGPRETEESSTSNIISSDCVD
jgi:hypothetical protein